MTDPLTKDLRCTVTNEYADICVLPPGHKGIHMFDGRIEPPTSKPMLPRFDSYGRELDATEPDLHAFYTRYSDARDEIERLQRERDEGWKAFNDLRKQVAEQRYPGMTGEVHADETTPAPKDDVGDTCPACGRNQCVCTNW